MILWSVILSLKVKFQVGKNNGESILEPTAPHTLEWSKYNKINVCSVGVEDCSGLNKYILLRKQCTLSCGFNKLT